MLRINCPWCGIRNEDEFAYGGDATVTRPTDEASAGDWYDFLYTRENPAGPHREYWHHANGCRAWILIERNTVSHEILNIAPASPRLPVATKKA